MQVQKTTPIAGNGRGERLTRDEDSRARTGCDRLPGRLASDWRPGQRALAHWIGWFRFTSPRTQRDDPATEPLERNTMKKDIHPEYTETQVTCTCGNTFTTRSTATSGIIHADVCSQCHPFYTGKQKILDTGGRVARFEARYAEKTAEPRSK